MKQGLLTVIALLSVVLFSPSAQAADTHAFVTQTSNASTLSFLNAATGTQVSGRALGINTNTGATYSADGSIAFVTETNEQTLTEALVAYSVPAGKHLGTVTIPNAVFTSAIAIPGTKNIFISVVLRQTQAAIYEVNGTTFTAKQVFETGASALALSPDGGTLYVSTFGSLLSVNTTTFKVTASVLIAGIDNIAVTPDGSLLILGISNGAETLVAEYNPATKTVVGTIPADAGADVGISPDGAAFYTTLTAKVQGAPTMLEQVSVASLTILNSLPIPFTQATLAGNLFAISPDGSKLAILPQVVNPEVEFVTLPALTAGPVTPVGNACGLAFLSAAFVSVTNCKANTVDVVDVTTGVLKTRYDAGPSPQSTLTSTNEAVLYVANPYGVWALSTKAGKILSKVEFPASYQFSQYGGQLALSADGTTLFAEYSTGVLEIATSNNQEIGAVPGVPTGFNVTAIATSPDGKYLFVAGTPANNFQDYELLLLNQTSGALISTVSASNASGIQMVPSKDSANLYYEALFYGQVLTLYDFNIASQTFTLIGSPTYGALALSPDGETLYVGGDTVEAIDTTTFAYTAIPSPVPVVGIAVTPDGSTLVVTSTANQLGVITIANPLIPTLIPIGGGTSGISVR